MPVVRCPNPDCPGRFRVKDEDVGRAAGCPKCRTRFVVRSDDVTGAVSAVLSSNPELPPSDRLLSPV